MTFEAALAVFVPPSLPLIITSAGLRCPPCCPLEKRQEKVLRFNSRASSIQNKPHQDHLNQPPCRANHNHCTWFLARDGRSWKAAAKSAERCGGGGGRHNCTVVRSFWDLLSSVLWYKLQGTKALIQKDCRPMGTNTCSDQHSSAVAHYALPHSLHGSWAAMSSSHRPDPQFIRSGFICYQK